jgi:uncharacterized delta-60 repeat protein
MGLGALGALTALVGSLLYVGPRAASAATAPSGSAGALDTTFGSNGVATLSVHGLSLTGLTHVLIQGDGKVLVGGIQPGVAGSVVVARFTSTGAVDTTFGAGKGYVKPGLGSGSTQDGAQIALQPDGKIVVVGSLVNSSGSTVVAVARLNSDGSADSTFATSGLATTSLGGSPLIHGSGVVVLSTGQLLVSAWAGSSGNFTLIRYSPNGALDPGFGSNGIAQATTAQGPVEATDLAVTAGGQIIEVGFAKVSGQFDTSVARFSSTGVPDVSFPSGGNKNGTEALDLSGKGISDSAAAVALDATGHILVSGTISSTPSVVYTVRLLANV